MNPLITEIKTRARLRLNALRRGSPDADEATDAKLRDCLVQVAREAGFQHWAHARHVLGGLAGPGDDQGTFWHAPGCTGLLNHWFAQHAAAREALATGAQRLLLPYRRQFVVVEPPYLQALGLDAADPAWAAAGRDLVQAYGSAAWLALCGQRLRAMRAAAAAPAQA